jgi:hypothetical protein
MNDARSEGCTWEVAQEEKGNNEEGRSRWGDHPTRREVDVGDLPARRMVDEEWSFWWGIPWWGVPHRRIGSREVVLGFYLGSS